MRDLEKLIALVAKHVEFNSMVYPELAEKSESERLQFAVRHSALHFAKTAGKIATVSERADHGEELNMDELRENTSKALINVLWLAERIGLSGDDLIRFIEEKYHERLS